LYGGTLTDLLIGDPLTSRQNHAAAAVLDFMCYNFGRVDQTTLRVGYAFAIAAMSAILMGCGTDRSSGEPPESAAARAAGAAGQSPYVGQPLPGLTPERFAPGLVSTDAIELNGVFSPDLDEFYFTRVVGGVDTMHQINFADGRWGSARELLIFPNHTRAEAADMVLSRDGQELFFLAGFPRAAPAEKQNYDIWRSRRSGDGWSEAELVPAPISTPGYEYYPSFGPDGSLYINSNRDGTGAIYRAARLADRTFAPPVKVGHPFLPLDGDLSFAPDGSFIVVSAQRPRIGGSFRNDLFISFRRSNGTYADFVSLDDTINTPAHEWCPMVTPDGRYLFFSRRFGAYDTQGWDGTTDGDVFWVDVHALDKYRSATP
jgi:hypothetical protein